MLVRRPDSRPTPLAGSLPRPTVIPTVRQSGTFSGWGPKL